MLTKFHKILIGALGLQVVLAVLLLTRSSDTGAAKAQPLLAGFDAAKVTRVQVFAESAEKPSVDLAKRNAAWVMASHFDYPVDATKVTNALAPLGKLAAAKPVATSATRHGQLRVGDKAFEKKVIVSLDGGKDLTFFVGASAGMRRNAFRLAGDDRVWGVTEIHSGTLGEEPAQWIDTAYYRATAADIMKLVVQRDGKTLELERVPAAPAAGSGSGSGSASTTTPDSWQVRIDGALVTLAAGETIDTAAIESRLGSVASITMRAPADPKRDASKPTATLTVHKRGAAAPDVLEVVAEGADATAAKDYWVQLKGLGRAALVDAATLKDVITLGRDPLVKKPDAAGAGSGAPPNPSGLPPGIELPPGFVPAPSP